MSNDIPGAAAPAGGSGGDPGPGAAPPPPPTSASAGPPPPPAPPPPPPPGGYPGRPPLRRSRTDRKIAGVAGGMGRYLNIDPLVFRIVLAVLAVFGGAGVLLYGIGWLLIPTEGEPESEGERLIRGRADGSAVAAIVAVLVGIGIFGGFIGNGFNTMALALLAIVAIGLVIAVRERGPREWVASSNSAPGGVTGPAAPGPAAGTGTPGFAAVSATPPSYPAPPSGPAPGSAPTAQYGGTPSAAPPPYRAPYPPPYARTYSPYAPPPPPVPAPPKERSALVGLTISAAVIVAGVLISLGLLWDNSVDVQIVLAVTMLVLGAGLVVGAWFGRGRSLMVWGSIVAVFLIVAASWSIPLKGGIGDRAWEPDSVAQVRSESPFRLAIGEGTLDLTQISPGEDFAVEASVGLGQLTVLVPEDVNVEGQAHVGIGNIQLPDESDTGGIDLDRNIDVRGTSTTTIVLDLTVGTGEVRVLRETP